MIYVLSKDRVKFACLNQKLTMPIRVGDFLD